MKEGRLETSEHHPVITQPPIRPRRCLWRSTSSTTTSLRCTLATGCAVPSYAVKTRRRGCGRAPARVGHRTGTAPCPRQHHHGRDTLDTDACAQPGESGGLGGGGACVAVMKRTQNAGDSQRGPVVFHTGYSENNVNVTPAVGPCSLPSSSNPLSGSETKLSTSALCIPPPTPLSPQRAPHHRTVMFSARPLKKSSNDDRMVTRWSPIWCRCTPMLPEEMVTAPHGNVFRNVYGCCHGSSCTSAARRSPHHIPQGSRHVVSNDGTQIYPSTRSRNTLLHGSSCQTLGGQCACDAGKSRRRHVAATSQHGNSRDTGGIHAYPET